MAIPRTIYVWRMDVQQDTGHAHPFPRVRQGDHLKDISYPIRYKNNSQLFKLS